MVSGAGTARTDELRLDGVKRLDVDRLDVAGAGYHGGAGLSLGRRASYTRRLGPPFGLMSERQLARQEAAFSVGPVPDVT